MAVWPALSGPLKLFVDLRLPPSETGFHLITLNLWIFYKVALIVTSALGLHSVAAGRPSILQSRRGYLMGKQIVWSGKGET
jgi:hypothetical protein